MTAPPAPPGPAAPAGPLADIVEEAERVVSRLRGAPKTTLWKARAMVGRRASWYELPEEVAGTGARR